MGIVTSDAMLMAVGCVGGVAGGAGLSLRRWFVGCVTARAIRMGLDAHEVAFGNMVPMAGGTGGGIRRELVGDMAGAAIGVAPCGGAFESLGGGLDMAIGTRGGQFGAWGMLPMT